MRSAPIFVTMLIPALLPMPIQLEAQVPTNGLVAYYTFDGNYNDTSPNQNHLTNHGAVLTKDRFGVTNSASEFDRTSYLSASDSVLPKDNSPRTISFWLKAEGELNELIDDSTGNTIRTGHLLSYGNSGIVDGWGGVWIELWNDNERFGVRYVSKGLETFLHSERNAQEGVWHQITYTFDGNRLRYFLNGRYIAARSRENFHDESGRKLFIGGWPNSNKRGINGAMDDIRIYDRPLSASEVVSLYEGERPPPTSDPVLIMPMNGNANDVSGNGHHGKVQGAILTEDRFGYPNSAYAFNGEDDVIVVPDHDNLDFDFSDFTLTAWFKRQPSDNHCYIVGKYRQGMFPGYGMGFTGQNGSYAFLGDNNTENGFVQPVSLRQITDTEWHFLAATYDRSENLRVYIDGRVYATNSITPETGSIRSDHDLYIGNLTPGLGFKGSIDDVALYNRALSTSEIRELMMKLPFDIIQQPEGGTIGTGGAVILSVKVEGKGDFTYQWFKDSVELSGATNPTFVLSQVSYEDAGSYYVEITTSDGSLGSDPAKILVEGEPVLVSQPSDTKLEVGQPLQLVVDAVGTESFTYQWFFNGQPFLGAKNQMLWIPDATEALSGEYYVVVTNPYGMVTSETATITVSFIDTDEDGIGNWKEIEMGTNPESPDTDGDGLTDLEETETTKTNPTLADTDSDGLTDSDELMGSLGYITNPLIGDTDGDGLSDGNEVLRETFPTNPLASDTDGDGLSDLNEIVLGINPTSADTDGDGLGDADEIRHGFDANNATEAPEGQIKIFRAVELQFFTLPKTYQLYWSSDLESWEEFGIPFASDGGYISKFVRQQVAESYWKLEPVD